MGATPGVAPRAACKLSPAKFKGATPGVAPRAARKLSPAKFKGATQSSMQSIEDWGYLKAPPYSLEIWAAPCSNPPGVVLRGGFMGKAHKPPP
jgi:hypothetical protein